MEMTTIKIKVSTRYINSEDSSEITFPKDAWESLTDEERDEVVLETLFEMIDWDWEEV